MTPEANAETNARGARFRVRGSQEPTTSSSDGVPLTGRRGVPLAVPLPYLVTGVGAAALFGEIGRAHV